MSYNTLNYEQQGGDVWVVGGDLNVVSGGDLDIKTGGKLKANGTQAAAIADSVGGGDHGDKINAILAALRGVGIIAL
jgi:hypothetical protein